MSKIRMQTRGIAVFPFLNKPDTKFDSNGEYHTKVRIDSEAAEKLLEKLTAIQEAEMEIVKGKRKGKRTTAADLPLQPELDRETGEETGSYLLKVATNATYKSRKTGKIIQKVLPLVDARGKEMSNSIDIWGGSEIVAAYQARPWSNPKGEVGVKCYLEAVQVIQLSSSSPRFAPVEGGFEAPEVDDEEAEDIEDDLDVDADDDDDGAGYDFA